VRALLVINPRSHRGSQLDGAIRAELRSLGVELVEDPSDGAIDAIVVAGGDGTLASQIPRALAAGVPIGLIPAGTFNDLARTLEIPFDVAQACATIAAGHTRRIDVARVNGVYYVTEASIGVSSRLARHQREDEKRRFGLAAVIANALLMALSYARPFNAEIAYDGRHDRFKAVQLTIANGERFGGFVNVEDAAIDDAWLDLYALEIESVAQALSVAAAVAGGKRRSARGLRTYRSTAFEVRTGRPHHITADGEPAGKTPARFEVVTKALALFVP